MGSGKIIKQSIKKYGKEKFEKKILEYCNEKNWISRERFWIKELNTNNEGYNLTLGGEGILGLKFSKESKLKMSNSQKGKLLSESTKKNISNALKGRNLNGGWNKGKSWNEETKIKMSKSHLGQKMKQQNKDKMSISKKELYSNKINHPRSKIICIHTPDNKKILCIGTFRIFRDKNKANYNKYFKKIIDSDIPINGWYFKVYKNINDIKNLDMYEIFKG